MLNDSAVVRSTAARALFLASAGGTVAILCGIQMLRLSRDSFELAPVFVYLFTVPDYSGAVASLLILGVAALFQRPAALRPMLIWIADHAAGIAAATGAALCLGAIIVYRNHPLSMDEYAPYFQSQAFASGSLTGRFPVPLLDWLVPPPFQDYFLDVSRKSGEVVSAYWPSFALLLTPFTRLGIPWACNPVISAVTLLFIRSLALQIFESREAAGLAMLMTLASPVFFADGISYYSMSAHLLANTVYAVLLVRPTAARAFVAGVVGSVALTLHNPVPHLLFAAPWLVWIVRREGGARLFGSLCAGYLPLCLLLGVGWYLFCSHLVHERFSAAVGGSAWVDLFARTASGFALPSRNVLIARLIGIAKLWLWAVPGLLLVAGVGAWKWRQHPICRVLAASALLTLLGYLFVPWDQGHGWGYRYFHSAWLALPVLAAGAFTAVRATGTPVPRFEEDGACSFLVACAVLTLVAGVGLRAAQIHQLITDDIRRVPAYSGHARSVVIIDPRLLFYGQDLVQNDPWLHSSVTRMLTHGAAADAEMMRAYFPEMHRVLADSYGSVWSAVSPTSVVAARAVRAPPGK